MFSEHRDEISERRKRTTQSPSLPRRLACGTDTIGTIGMFVFCFVGCFPLIRLGHMLPKT